MKASSRILVVDDNRSNRLIFERGLTSRGFEVLEAADGTQALEILAPTLHPPSDRTAGPDAIHLVVLDIMMPQVDGFEVLREIRRHRSRSALPVIMATAKDSTDDIVEALVAGANDYVTKPVSLPVLHARVETQLDLLDTHRALREAHQSLVRSAKMEATGYLAAGVAHEIRNPLARIKMSLGTLLRDQGVAADERLARAARIMESSLEKADEVVQGLMKFSRETRLDLQATDVNSVVTQTLAMIADDLEAAKLALVTELEPELPPALVARPEFTQVLLNLLGNAQQAMGVGGGTLTVRTAIETVGDVPESEGSRSGNRMRQGDKAVLIEILDTGPGISPGDEQRLFDPFYTTRPAGAGIGMGLTVARKIIELHAGLLTLANRDSSPGARVGIHLRTATSFQTGA